MAAKKKTTDTILGEHAKALAIKPLRFDTARFYLLGTSPLIMHRFSQKSRQEAPGR